MSQGKMTALDEKQFALLSLGETTLSKWSAGVRTLGRNSVSSAAGALRRCMYILTEGSVNPLGTQTAE